MRRISQMKQHPIKQYCEEMEIPQAEFARRMGLSAPYISQIIHGAAEIGRVAAQTIVAKTGGEITLLELLTWQAPPASRGSG